MDAIYLICLLVGGFFVALSIFGGADSEADADFDVDADADFDLDFDADVDADVDMDLDMDHGGGADIGSGVGFVDLLSLRFVFLFAAFFGLTGVMLQWLSAGEPFTFFVSLITGLVIGLGGNYVIKTVGYRTVSSDITIDDLMGTTAQVMLPFSGKEKGKITLIAKGNRMTMIAQSIDQEGIEFNPGDEVVVVKVKDSVAEVVKPN